MMVGEPCVKVSLGSSEQRQQLIQAPNVNLVTHDERFDPISGFPLMKAEEVRLEADIAIFLSVAIEADASCTRSWPDDEPRKPRMQTVWLRTQSVENRINGSAEYTEKPQDIARSFVHHSIKV